VDDNEFNIHSLSLLLKTVNLESNFALNGIQALQKITEVRDCGCQYQLILLDCNMPIMDGYDTCKELRKLVEQQKIDPLHIIAVTADVTPLNIKRCEEVGFEEVLGKPFHFS
jgi:CheY-like chemotaxis protein